MAWPKKTYLPLHCEWVLTITTQDNPGDLWHLRHWLQFWHGVYRSLFTAIRGYISEFCLFETYEHFRVNRHLIKHWKVKINHKTRKLQKTILDDQKLSLFPVLAWHMASFLQFVTKHLLAEQFSSTPPGLSPLKWVTGLAWGLISTALHSESQPRCHNVSRQKFRPQKW